MTPNTLRNAAFAVLAGIAYAPVGMADLSSYSQDFEGLDQTDPAALAGDGWLFFGNVFDSAGNYLFGYGPGGAPNGGPGFSAIVTGEGGAGQGAQQLSIYSDYNCCQPSNGHFNGTDRVEANVFQEQTIGAVDVGSTWTFGFEAKAGTIDDNVNSSTALAFIKTLDPSAGFFVTNFVTVDTTNVSTTWTGGSMSLTIDASLVGQILQVGFANTSENFEDTGVFYDNITFNDGSVDTDGDGVSDATDNCTLKANPGQQDTDGDGHGNACDPDIFAPPGNCFVDFLDLGAVKAAFFSTPASPNWNADADFDSSNFVDFVDLGVIKEFFFGGPGPSAAGTCP